VRKTEDLLKNPEVCI